MSRANRRVPVDIYVNKMINGVPFLARTKDLSREGVYLHRLLEPNTPTGAHLALEFMLPGSEEIFWAEAEVVHGDPDAGLGLRFKDLSASQSQLLDDFVVHSSAMTVVELDNAPVAAAG